MKPMVCGILFPISVAFVLRVALVARLVMSGFLLFLLFYFSTFVFKAAL